MRRIHDATAVFVPPKDEQWFTGSTMRPGWIVGHQDAAPYNAVMDGDRLVASRLEHSASYVEALPGDFWMP